MKRSKKIIILLSAFLIPVLMVCIHLIYMEITDPGYFSSGENFLLADMSSQYNSLYSYIQDVYLNKASIFYSFSKSIGGNMASTIGYYLGSPFNFLYVFFPKDSIPLCTFIIYLIKIGLCGTFMCYYLSKKENTKSYLLLIFSTSYALCGYTVNYYFNNMWLDVVLMTPLVMYGIDYLIKQKRIYLYSIFLAISIVSNYYISYMLCIFCVIYFAYEVIKKYNIRKDFRLIKKDLLNFTVGSLIAGGLACFILLPAITNLSQIMRFETDPLKLKYDMRGLKNTIFNDMLSKLYVGSHSKESSLSRNRPNLYFGIFSLVLCYFYYFNKNIKVKEKILTFIITAFFLLSCYQPYLNIFWHAFSFPNGYICRFTFLFSFFMILIACRTFFNLSKIKIIPSTIFIGIYIWIAKYISTLYLVFLEKKDIIISCVFVIIYIILLFILSRIKKFKTIFSVLLIALVFIEIFINFSDCFISNKKMRIITSYKTYYNDVCPEIKALDEDFYRIDGDYFYSYLDSMICGFSSITSSLSTNDGNLYNTYYNYGLSITYTTVTEDINKLPIMDSLLGVKYVYAKDEQEESIYKYKKTFVTQKYNYVYKMWKDKNIYVYENPYVLNIGYLVSEDYDKIYKRGNFKNRFEYLNSLMRSLSGNNKDIFHEVKGEYLGDNQYRYNIDTDSEYLYLAYDYGISINWTSYDSIYINDEYVTTGNSDDIGILKILNKYENQDIFLKFMDSSSYNTKNIDSLSMYYFDLEQFKEDIEYLKENQMNVKNMEKNIFEGEINVVNGKNILFLSIPYDKGWNVYVDSKKHDYFKIADGFIGIRLNEGKHNIKMKYYSPNFFLGILISVLSIICLIIYERYNKKLSKKGDINE